MDVNVKSLPDSLLDLQYLIVLVNVMSTLIKKKIKFSSYMYKEIQNGAVAKSYMTNGLLIYGE
jgi:hypothetical protein